MNPKNMPRSITVVIRDESPLHINEPCSYRRVTIELTDAQRIALEMRNLGSMGREQPSNCFLEFTP